jgi:hypothetical protein
MARAWGGFKGRGRPRRRRLTGCLLWLLALLVLLFILSVLFGNFQVGTKASGVTRPTAALTLAAPR